MPVDEYHLEHDEERNPEDVAERTLVRRKELDHAETEIGEEREDEGYAERLCIELRKRVARNEERHHRKEERHRELGEQLERARIDKALVHCATTVEVKPILARSDGK
jgi:hypothetical protein